MKRILTLLALFFTAGAPAAQTPASVVEGVVDAALALIEAADDTQRERALFLFPFDDQEQRRRWSNLPTGVFARSGLRLGDHVAHDGAAQHHRHHDRGLHVL